MTTPPRSGLAPDEILALARDARTASDLLRDLLTRAERAGGPVYDAGWKYPIATLVSNAQHLDSWADRLEALAAEP